MRKPRILLVLAILLSPLHTPTSTKAQTTPKTNENLIYSIKGPDLFRAYCAVCHGPSGKGDGPMASSLKTKPSDLTLLVKRNKGRFPAARVRSIIAGDEDIKSHGTREMPIWGPIFHQIENDQDFGNVRLENLVKFLESIQQK
jgi:mono/diheme cytochrome c family protein